MAGAHRISDLADLTALLANFGDFDRTRDEGDRDHDSDVDLVDLSNLLTAFGTVLCP